MATFLSDLPGHRFPTIPSDTTEIQHSFAPRPRRRPVTHTPQQRRAGLYQFPFTAARPRLALLGRPGLTPQSRSTAHSAAKGPARAHRTRAPYLRP